MWLEMYEIIHVKGNTFCIDTGMTYIPFYKVNEKEIIMLDSGWAEGEQEKLNTLLDYNDFKVVGIINSHSHIESEEIQQVIFEYSGYHVRYTNRLVFYQIAFQAR